ncbi:hypothetical protein PF008_g553 [Phytophthora fragariae]|uniref:Protein kinase domain-containing protein n=1 Tax=Phytophthora fragariae TaxID=53985 RepID=A0A6G0SMM7_9STRA|nr:hypothetical protein PF008_g553 [Phytophthora fragariae]
MAEARRRFFLLLLLQSLVAAASERFVLSRAGNASAQPLGETLVPLQLSAAALTAQLATSQDLTPVALDSRVAGGEWTLSNWSKPLAEIRAQTSGTDQTVLVDVQLSDAPLDVDVSQLLLQADATPLEDAVQLTLSFGKDALTGLADLAQVHVDGMRATFEDAWLPTDVDLNQLIFDEATVDKLHLESTVTIQQVVVRKSNLSFPTAVLGLDTAVATLILEYNTIAGPIELTENEFTQLSNISDFRTTGNVVDASSSGSSSCLKEETVGELTFCIVDDVHSTSASLYTGSTSSGSSEPTGGSLGTQSTNSSNASGVLSTTAIVLACACTVVLVVVVSFFRRFKKKASKFVDERLTFSNHEDGLLTGRGSDTGSEPVQTTEAKILADMDLGRDQVALHKKLGVQGLWLGEYKDLKVVALKFVPRELNRKLPDLNAIRLSYVPLRHDNIVRFLGSSWTDREEVLLVVEHMPNGSLGSVLADEKVQLAWPQRLQMARDISSALNFIRSIQGIKLSRNLTAKSVLLDAQFTCKLDIFDYALSLRTDLVPVRSYGYGDIATRAPELLKGEEITAAAEVYALGAIFCEISSRSKLFEYVSEERGPTMADIFIATEVVAQRLKPTPASDAPVEFRELTLRCLDYDPSKRPNISEILSMLSK